MKKNIRNPIVAGLFYPSTATEIRALLESLKAAPNDYETNNDQTIVGGVVPHAGYIYSGKHAITFFQNIAKLAFDTAIILSPGHTGEGLELSIDPHSHWQTPLGTIETDNELIKSNLFTPNKEAQQKEHAAEVIIPMIQHFCPQIKNIAVITMRNQSYKMAQEVAKGISNYQDNTKKRILIIASCDFSHFLSPNQGFENDSMVLHEIMAGNIRRIEEKIKKYNLSICGYGPIMALMLYLETKHKNICYEVISRGHSGEVCASNSVVDYITIQASIPHQVL
ncbi:MAG: AmmeMemoRadiSam system protein B [Salinivirgaceae bacterium]|nr:AmmeMemoRadiSam system protein B [Salinivirgaceae bacterium]MDD4747073.1 AmmeMemoRadiSam system protein B [Salinivirgaceae bacterium]